MRLNTASCDTLVTLLYSSYIVIVKAVEGSPASDRPEVHQDSFAPKVFKSDDLTVNCIYLEIWGHIANLRMGQQLYEKGLKLYYDGPNMKII